MIVTLTPNPPLDRTVALPGPLVRGGVNRLTSVVTHPGGITRIADGAHLSVDGTAGRVAHLS